MMSSSYKVSGTDFATKGGGRPVMPKNEYLKCRTFENQTIEDTEFVVSDDVYINFLGPGLTLRRCKVVVRATSRNWQISGARFVDCAITAKRKQVNFQLWSAGHFERCTFTGHFYSNDFGNWGEYPGAHPMDGSVVHCDFSGAILNFCRFMRSDMATMTLPKWPSFTILDPRKHGRDFVARPWPDTMRIWAQCVADDLEICSALVYHASSLANRYGCTEGEIRDALEGSKWVVM
jgi:hypothetical protein